MRTTVCPTCNTELNRKELDNRQFDKLYCDFCGRTTPDTSFAMGYSETRDAYGVMLDICIECNTKAMDRHGYKLEPAQ